MPIVTYSFDSLPPVNEKELENLRNKKNSDIDFSDMPALSTEQMKSMYEKGKNVKNKLPNTYIDEDIIKFFKKKDKNWQKRLNEFLHSAVSTFAL